LGAGCKKIRRRGPLRTGRVSGRESTGCRPSGAGGRIERWHGSGRARAHPGAAVSSRRSRVELRPPPAISPALSRRQSGPGKHHRRAVRALDRERGSSGARRAAAPGSRRAGPLRSALAFARSSQSSRRPLGGRGAARARLFRGGRVAASALAAVAGPGRHRLGGDRAHRHRRRNRDQDPHVRPAPSRSDARAGGLAVTAPAKMGTQRGAWSRVSLPFAWPRARRG
jgi:hypothetical protein